MREERSGVDEYLAIEAASPRILREWQLEEINDHEVKELVRELLGG